MHVAVVGGGGMLGHVLLDLLRERSHTAVSIPGALAFHRIPAGVDAVVNCCAFIPEHSPALTVDMVRLNAVLPQVLARAGPPLLHISTDGVFSGARGLSTEKDEPDDPTPYGITKRAGEAPGCMVLRASHVGPEVSPGRHLLSRLATAREFTCYTNHMWNGMTTLALAQGLVHILERGLWQVGVFHLFGQDVTKAHLCHGIKTAFDLPVELHAAPAAVAVDRRLRTLFPVNACLPVAPLAVQLQELRAWMEHPARVGRYSKNLTA